MQPQFFLFIIVIIFAVEVVQGKIIIDLNRENKNKKSKNAPKASITNTHTGIKVTSHSEKVSTAIDSEVPQKIENVPKPKSYIKKGEVRVEHSNPLKSEQEKKQQQQQQNQLRQESKKGDRKDQSKHNKLKKILETVS
jgi:hypothetical protein